MKSMLAMFIFLIGFSAQADGFLCAAPTIGVNLQIYNRVHPSLGTKNPAVMIISKSEAQAVSKTIAVFRPESGALKKEGENIIAYMQKREDDVASGIQHLANWRLDDIFSVVVGIDFSYANPVEVGTPVYGEMVLVHQNGDRYYFDLNCQRYLKN